MNKTIKTISSKELDNMDYGLINVSVANLRKEPAHKTELVTQALLGEVIKIFEKSPKGWYKVQTQDEYIAWIEEDVIIRTDKSGIEKYLNNNRIIYDSNFGFSYSKPDENSQTVSDLVKGNILENIGKENGFVKVEYPDSRIAYIPEKNCMNINEWIENININSQNIIIQAKNFLGIPYLWGGTSVKGVDCSGFTKLVFYFNGIFLPRDASQQAEVGEFVTDEIEFGKFQPADLLFFGPDKKGTATHVGIYIGDGEFIHSSGFVRINSLMKERKGFSEYRYKEFLFAKRIISSHNIDGVKWIKKNKTYFMENE